MQAQHLRQYIISGLLTLIIISGVTSYSVTYALEVNDINPVSWFSSNDNKASEKENTKSIKKAREAYEESLKELKEATVSVQVAEQQLKAAKNRHQSAHTQTSALKSTLDKLTQTTLSQSASVEPAKTAQTKIAKEPEKKKQDDAYQLSLIKESDQKKNNAASNTANGLAAVIKTEKGDIAIELYPDKAPITVANFVHLIRTGFYNQPGLKFHRVVPGFVIQTGDPTGTGAGGSKERIPLEVENKLSHNEPGIVAMARGPNPHSATSQFYITLEKQENLDGKYAIFGKVIRGLEVIKSIEKGDKFFGAELTDKSAIIPDPKPKKASMWGNWLN